MATWKRLTLVRTDHVEVDVNLDHVIYMVSEKVRETDRTRLYFVGGPNTKNETRSIDVQEPPDEIHTRETLRSLRQ